MASFQVTGFISTVKYLPDACLVFVDEFKKGFRKADGMVVTDKYLTWKCIFKGYFKNYVSKHFAQGMLVEVKGEVMPYAIEKDRIVDGYSVIGQTINLASYPRASVKQEQRMIKESQESAADTMGTPDLDAYTTPDF